jgi:putative addiction module killer protein
VLEIREYIDELGRSRHADWISRLDDATQARIAIGLRRVGTGNFSNVKSVGSGVFELKLNFGPGFRVYLTREGDHLILLLGGGTKSRQESDIERAKSAWQAYRRRKKAGEL